MFAYFWDNPCILTKHMIKIKHQIKNTKLKIKPMSFRRYNLTSECPHHYDILTCVDA